MEKANINNHHIAIAIFACNESGVIERTIHSIQNSMRNSDALFVIADNCTDDTALRSLSLGANVFIRNNPKHRGKGAAISWFVKEHYQSVRNFDQIVILDADSLVPANFFTQLETHLAHKMAVGQCALLPVDYETTPLSLLIGLSDLIEQTVFDRIRSRLGFSVRLRGTGMVFDPRLLLDLCHKIDTEVEDIVLSLLLAEHGIIVKSLPSVQVLDPKPNSIIPASNQRARWFRGQISAFWKYRRDVIKTFFSGLNGCSTLCSIFLKPRWLQLLILTCLGFLCLHYPVASISFFSLVAIQVILIVIGIIGQTNRKVFFKSLLFLPVFLFMWLIGIKLSLKCLPWLRVRSLAPIDSAENEFIQEQLAILSKGMQ